MSRLKSIATEGFLTGSLANVATEGFLGALGEIADYFINRKTFKLGVTTAFKTILGVK